MPATPNLTQKGIELFQLYINKINDFIKNNPSLLPETEAYAQFHAVRDIIQICLDSAKGMWPFLKNLHDNKSKLDKAINQINLGDDTWAVSIKSEYGLKLAYLTLQFLNELRKNIGEYISPGSLLNQITPLLSQFFSKEVTIIIQDEKQIFGFIQSYLDTAISQLENKIRFYRISHCKKIHFDPDKMQLQKSMTKNNESTIIGKLINIEYSNLFSNNTLSFEFKMMDDDLLLNLKKNEEIIYENYVYSHRLETEKNIVIDRLKKTDETDLNTVQREVYSILLAEIDEEKIIINRIQKLMENIDKLERIDDSQATQIIQDITTTLYNLPTHTLFVKKNDYADIGKMRLIPYSINIITRYLIPYLNQLNILFAKNNRNLINLYPLNHGAILFNNKTIDILESYLLQAGPLTNKQNGFLLKKLLAEKFIHYLNATITDLKSMFTKDTNDNDHAQYLHQLYAYYYQDLNVEKVPQTVNIQFATILQNYIEDNHVIKRIDEKIRIIEHSPKELWNYIYIDTPYLSQPDLALLLKDIFKANDLKIYTFIHFNDNQICGAYSDNHFVKLKIQGKPFPGSLSAPHHLTPQEMLQLLPMLMGSTDKKINSKKIIASLLPETMEHAAKIKWWQYKKDSLEKCLLNLNDSNLPLWSINIQLYQLLFHLSDSILPNLRLNLSGNLYDLLKKINAITNHHNQIISLYHMAPGETGKLLTETFRSILDIFSQCCAKYDITLSADRLNKFIYNEEFYHFINENITKENKVTLSRSLTLPSIKNKSEWVEIIPDEGKKVILDEPAKTVSVDSDEIDVNIEIEAYHHENVPHLTYTARAAKYCLEQLTILSQNKDFVDQAQNCLKIYLNVDIKTTTSNLIETLSALLKERKTLFQPKAGYVYSLLFSPTKDKDIVFLENFILKLSKPCEPSPKNSYSLLRII